MLWRESVADTAPLARLLELFVDEAMLAEVAAEHKKGRRLIIGTTQLDAQRLVLWDMGAIATSGHPDAIKLFREVMLASASIPGAFPPQYIKVEAGGGFYDEMHVDGGTTAQVIITKPPWTRNHDCRAGYLIPGTPTHSLYYPEFPGKTGMEDVRPRLAPIGARAISTLIKYHGVGDLFRLYVFANGITWNPIWRPFLRTPPPPGAGNLLIGFT